MLSKEDRGHVTKLTAAIVTEFDTLDKAEPEQKSFQDSVESIGAALHELEILCGIQFFRGPAEIAVESAPEVATRAAAPSSAAQLGVEDFFKQVADGVVKAQQDLDIRSEEYLRNRSPISAPAVFRIPKVTAEFTLGAE